MFVFLTETSYQWMTLSQLNSNYSISWENTNFHMNLMTPIWDRVIKSQTWGGHDFSLTHHGTRNTILKDMKKPSLSFSKPRQLQDCCTRWVLSWYDHCATWPHTPVDLFVCPFQAALYLLLLKPELMQQSNLSLPNRVSHRISDHASYPSILIWIQHSWHIFLL